jgi:TolB protein
MPSWSPDGKRIAFTMIRNDSTEIGIVNRDGTGFVQLTNDGQQNRSPVWSPDGRQLAFFSAQGGLDDVYMMNNDGSNVIRVTRTERCVVGCAGPADARQDLHWLP